MTGYVRQSVADILPGEEVRSEPLNAEFNRIQVAFDGSVGHTHDGTAGSGPPINLATSIAGTLPVANGGTGVTTLAALKTALSLGTAAYTSLTDYATAAQGTKADGALQRSGGTMTGAINMGGFGLSNVGTIALNNQKITGMAAPTADTDAATRKYVLDTLASVDTSAFGAHVNNKSNPHEVTKAQVGLGNADNTSDANKPVSTATQTALDLKANLASPTFTGTPSAPTPSVSTNTTQLATTAFVQSAISNNVPVATTSDINNSTGSGFTNAQTLGPILNEMRDVTGDLMESFRVSGTGSANWLECNGSIVLKATYPDLFNIIGQRYADFINLSSVSVSSGIQVTAQGFLDSFIYVVQSNDTTATNVLLYSNTDGSTLTPITLTSQIGAIGDFFKFKNNYVLLPSVLYTNGSGATTSQYSTSGTSFTRLVETDSGNQTGSISYATDDDVIIGVIAGSASYFKKTAPNVGFVHTAAALPTQVKVNVVNKGIAYGNGAFVFIGNDNKLYWSTNQATSWTACTQSENVNGGDIIFFDGKFYAFASSTSVLSSTDGKTFTRFALASDIQIQQIYTDGERLIVMDQNSDLRVLPADGKHFLLSLSFRGTSAPRYYKYLNRKSDGLFFSKINGASIPVSRAKIAPNKTTEFQLPNFQSLKTAAKVFIRGKIV